MATNRSPNYPAISLQEAVELVEKLYQRERRSPVDAERAALALGYRGLSGASRTKLSGLRKFELVDETPGGIRVSDLAMAILHPTNDQERQDALRKAATIPALFRDLATYPGASDDNLVSRLVRMGFTEAGAKLAVASYRKTMSLAGGEAIAYDSGDEDIPNAAESMLEPSTGGRKLVPPSTNRGGTVLYVPLPGGTKAELRLPAESSLEALEAIVEWVRTAPTAPEASPDAESIPTPELGTSEPPQLSAQSPDAAQD